MAAKTARAVDNGKQTTSTPLPLSAGLSCKYQIAEGASADDLVADLKVLLTTGLASLGEDRDELGDTAYAGYLLLRQAYGLAEALESLILQAQREGEG